MSRPSCSLAVQRRISFSRVSYIDFGYLAAQKERSENGWLGNDLGIKRLGLGAFGVWGRGLGETYLRIRRSTAAVNNDNIGAFIIRIGFWGILHF